MKPAVSPPAISDHELLRCIGRGSYGEVWLARNVLGTLRAVKIVRRSAFEEGKPFQREFHGMQKFEPISRSHEGLVGILQVGANEAEGCFYYVMELADGVAAGVPPAVEGGVSPPGSGPTTPSASSHRTPMPPGETPGSTAGEDARRYIPRTLRSDIKRRGPLPPAECVAIGLSLARALAHLHGHKLVHRDIKPSNIIFIGGAPRLADIGLVTDLDATRTYVGTEGFMPPEGSGTPQADLYALGKVLYEMATGKDRQEFPDLPTELGVTPHPPCGHPLPSEGRGQGEGCVAANPQSANPVLRAFERSALLELNEIFTKACATDPRQRYQSAEEMHADLELLQSGQSVKRKRAAQWRWVAVWKSAIAALLLAVIAAGGVLVWQQVRPPPSAAKGMSANPDANREYQLSRHHFTHLSTEHINQAESHVRRAIQLDPNFVQAYVLLFGISMWQPKTPGGGPTTAEQCADKLLAIAPNLGDGHAARAYCLLQELKWDEAEAEFRLALKLSPDSDVGTSIYGWMLSLQGRIEEAHQMFNRTIEIDPTSRIAVTLSGYSFYAARDFDRAIERFKEAIRLQPDFALARSRLAMAYVDRGNYLAAISEFEKMDLLSGADPKIVEQKHQPLREAYIQRGQSGYWLKVLEQLERGNNPEAHASEFAEAYARMGDKSKALDWLERTVEVRFLQFYAFADVLRDEPRYHALLKKVGLER